MAAYIEKPPVTSSNGYKTMKNENEKVKWWYLKLYSSRLGKLSLPIKGFHSTFDIAFKFC
jgi:hypothetical protein